jgi:hypothetical protein
LEEEEWREVGEKIGALFGFSLLTKPEGGES